MTDHLTDHQRARLADFLGPARIATVATIARDGTPHLTPNWYHFDGDRLAISTTRDRVKYRNLCRDPRMSVCVASEPMARDYVSITGPVSISEDDSIWPVTRIILGRYMSADVIDRRIDQMRSEGRVILWLTPERVLFRN